jgi:hypothetical protein
LLLVDNTPDYPSEFVGPGGGGWPWWNPGQASPLPNQMLQSTAPLNLYHPQIKAPEAWLWWVHWAHLYQSRNGISAPSPRSPLAGSSARLWQSPTTIRYVPDCTERQMSVTGIRGRARKAWACVDLLLPDAGTSASGENHQVAVHWAQSCGVVNQPPVDVEFLGLWEHSRVIAVELLGARKMGLRRLNVSYWAILAGYVR